MYIYIYIYIYTDTYIIIYIYIYIYIYAALVITPGSSPLLPHVEPLVSKISEVWGRRAEGDITLESNFRAAPPVADFMDQPPWSLWLNMTIPEDVVEHGGKKYQTYGLSGC